MKATIKYKQKQARFEFVPTFKIKYLQQQPMPRKIKTLTANGARSKSNCKMAVDTQAEARQLLANPEIRQFSDKKPRLGITIRQNWSTQFDPQSRKMHHIDGKKQQISRLTDHKISLDTTTSSNPSSCQRSEKKRIHSLSSHEDKVAFREQIIDLKQKHQAYDSKTKKSVPSITKSMRVILGGWLAELGKELQIPSNAVYNAINYLDRYVSLVPTSRKQYQVVGLCAIALASKIELSSCPKISTFLEAVDNSLSREQLVVLETQMAFKLAFRLNPPTLYQYMALIVSLFEHFARTHYKQWIRIPPNGELYHDIFWVILGVYLEDSYRKFHDKEKVCLSILFICLKKEYSTVSKSNLVKELQSLASSGRIERVFEGFLQSYIGVHKKLSELKECISHFVKWARFERNTAAQSNQIQYLKKIIFNEF